VNVVVNISMRMIFITIEMADIMNVIIVNIWRNTNGEGHF